MILIDANVWMYSVGSDDPHREPSRELLRRVGEGEVEGVVSVEILHEILHRYRSVNRWVLGNQVYESARECCPVLPVTEDVLEHARQLMYQFPRLQTRDAVHAATVRIHSLDGIYSYDSDFDGIEGVRRFVP
jgi:predicted nucleic acid-binding protein